MTVILSFNDYKLLNKESYQKRVQKEIEFLFAKNICDENSIYISFEETNEMRVTFKNNKDSRQYDLIFCNRYPFRIPKLFINSKPYHYYLRINSPFFSQTLRKEYFMNCFCCSSILCDDNWAVIMTINNILCEVSNFHEIVRKIVDQIIVKVIKRKYLIDDINIMEWLHK